MQEKLIALTFDDGPNSKTTPLVLKKLKKYGVTATFFLIGCNMNKRNLTYGKKAFKMGCELCNHSKTHSAFPSLTDEQMINEILYTNEKIKRITGDLPIFFRPPYIAYDDRTFRNVDMTFICGIGSNDWDDSVSIRCRYEKTLEQCRDGTIILMHDSIGNIKTVKALDLIIPELKRLGYTFVTVSELFERKGVTPRHGVIYSNVND